MKPTYTLFFLRDLFPPHKIPIAVLSCDTLTVQNSVMWRLLSPQLPDTTCQLISSQKEKKIHISNTKQEIPQKPKKQIIGVKNSFCIYYFFFFGLFSF